MIVSVIDMRLRTVAPDGAAAGAETVESSLDDIDEFDRPLIDPKFNRRCCCGARYIQDEHVSTTSYGIPSFEF